MTLVCGFLFLSTRYSFVRRDEVEVEVGGSTALRHVFFFSFFFFTSSMHYVPLMRLQAP